jgi:hypothetical protein
VEDRVYCPKCGTKTERGINFCRTCGTDVRLVSAALTGVLGPADTNRKLEARSADRTQEDDGKIIARAVQEGSIGVGFLVISFCVFLFMPGGKFWWFWLLIPTFALLGKSVAAYLELKHRSRPAASAVPPIPAAPPQASLDDAHQFELSPPPSVTETTTRHLELDAPRREPEP